MKYCIIYVPTDEYVAFNGKLFTDDENEIQQALLDLLYADGGYDGSDEDFQINVIDYPNDGSEFVKDDMMFVQKSVVDA